jgi:hypothetical protein
MFVGFVVWAGSRLPGFWQFQGQVPPMSEQSPFGNRDELAAQVQSKIMELQKFGAGKQVTVDFVRSAGITVTAEMMYDALTVQMKTHILSDKIGEASQPVWAEHRATVNVPIATRYLRWGFWPSVKIVDTDVEVDFCGTIAVKAEMFNIFPEARPDGYYPQQFGRQREFYRFSQDFS